MIFVFAFISNLLLSQGLVENDLTFNQVIAAKYNEMKERSLLKTPSAGDTITLGPRGFIDEFSYEGPYPDTALWMDNYVFINREFPKAPKTLGVATFDGLDNTGYPYDFSATATSSGQADYLTSKPINLSFIPGDSLYFSFYYQPQGRGNAPEYTDSLVVQFKGAGISSPFRNVWAKKGSTLAVNDSSWKLVMIPITDTAYLKKGFQFRFKNYATLSGNTDHWNVDYVYLNKGRTKIDTSFNDVSFVYNGTPLLENYRQIPWEQCKRSELRDSVTNLLRYNIAGTATVIKVFYGHQITDDVTSTVLSNYAAPGFFNLLPYDSTHTYTECDVAAGCRLYSKVDTNIYSLPPFPLTAPTQITIKHFISTGTSNLNPQNDTLKVHQLFLNSYAYDDGTAENSFGLSVLHGQLAEKFSTNFGDSLQYIDIFFNPFLTNTSVYTFNLMVWSDAAGVPGSPLYVSGSVLSPAYGGITYNQFIRYKLDAPIYLFPGNYYFGFQQNTNQFLNVGVDKNNNTQSKIFYNVSGSWLSSPFTGSLMLHPVFGKYTDFLAGVSEVETKSNLISVYPNPASDELFIRASDGNLSDRTTYSVIDIMGRVVIDKTIYSHSIDISDLKNGIYFIQIKEGSQITTHKFIKSK